MILNLSTETELSLAISPADGTAATTDINGAIVDTQDGRAVQAIVVMGTITSGAVTSLKWQQGATSNLSDAADLEGSAQTIADTRSNKVFYSDLVRPTERYVRLVIDRGTQNAVVAGAVYQLYQLKKEAGTHSSDVTGELLVSPAEGTA